jgi:multisubunit Na+/H+ antiporter MnhC subunit
MNATNNDEAQRDREQKALMNVRALVDKLEEKEIREKASQKKVVTWLVIGIAGGALMLYLATRVMAPGETREIKSSPAASTPNK